MKARKKIELTEGEILRQVRDYLRLKGFFVIRIQQGLGCHPGISDLICIRYWRDRSEILWVEVKRLKGKLSEKQEKFRKDITEHGGLYLVIHSLEEIQEWVK